MARRDDLCRRCGRTRSVPPRDADRAATRPERPLPNLDDDDDVGETTEALDGPALLAAIAAARPERPTGQRPAAQRRPLPEPRARPSLGDDDDDDESTITNVAGTHPGARRTSAPPQGELSWQPTPRPAASPGHPQRRPASVTQPRARDQASSRATTHPARKRAARAPVPDERPSKARPRTVGLDEVDAQGALQVAVQLEQAGRVPDAVRFLEEAVERWPAAAPLYNRLAIMFMGHYDDLDRAEALARRALDLSPRHPIFQRTLNAVTLRRREDGKRRR